MKSMKLLRGLVLLQTLAVVMLSFCWRKEYARGKRIKQEAAEARELREWQVEIGSRIETLWDWAGDLEERINKLEEKEGKL